MANRKKTSAAAKRASAGVLREEAPPYRINGGGHHRQLHCVDLFAGCGGLSLGLEEAGFKPLLFSEINPQAAETYIANRTGMDITPVDDLQPHRPRLGLVENLLALQGHRGH